MSESSLIEFYDIKGAAVASVRSAMVPGLDSRISIRKETWEVLSVTYAVDDADAPAALRTMRANVTIRRA